MSCSQNVIILDQSHHSNVILQLEAFLSHADDVKLGLQYNCSQQRECISVVIFCLRYTIGQLHCSIKIFGITKDYLSWGAPCGDYLFCTVME